MPKDRHTDHEKAAAVARVRTGESIRSVARSHNVSDATVRRWISAAERRATAREKALAEDADRLAEEINRLTRVLRHELLEGIRQTIPRAIERGSLQALAVTYGIVTDKDLRWAEQEARARSRGDVAGEHEGMTDAELDQRIRELLEDAGEG